MMNKRIICIILSLSLLSVLLASCGDSGRAEPTPLPTVSLEPTITAPPTPTPTPKPSIGPYFEPTVTKSPGPENRVEGSAIYFSAFADDMVSCEWQLINDEEEVIPGNKIADSFDGLVAAGIYDNYLVLGNIPLELDGWSVRCKFIGSGLATVYSEPALINVYERKVKLHGAERKTVKGTGNLSGFGAIIDFEGENWWDVEEYTGALFTILPADVQNEYGITEGSFEIAEDGAVTLKLGETEYTGFVNPDRLGGHSASAGMFPSDSDAELTVWFDYTQYSQSMENWNQIYVQVPLELPPEEEEETDGAAAAANGEKPEATSEDKSSEAASGSTAAAAADKTGTDKTNASANTGTAADKGSAGTGASKGSAAATDDKTSSGEEATAKEKEPRIVLVTFIFTRTQ